MPITGNIKVGDKFTLKCGVLVEVVRYYCASQIVVADAEGNEKTVRAGNLSRGLVGWPTAPREYSDGTKRASKFHVGSIHPTNNWGDVEIVKREGGHYLTVKFLRTGHIKEHVSYVNLYNGKVGDFEKGVEKRPVGNYVYIARCKGAVVYVGHGIGDRYRHCNNGRSSSYYLNKLHFSGETIAVEIAADRLSKDVAAQVEKQLIAYYKPEGNTLTYQV